MLSRRGFLVGLLASAAVPGLPVGTKNREVARHSDLMPAWDYGDGVHIGGDVYGYWDYGGLR